MPLADILLAKGLVSKDEIMAGVAHQKENGGRFCDALVATGVTTSEIIDEVLSEAPAGPKIGAYKFTLILRGAINILLTISTRYTKFGISGAPQTQKAKPSLSLSGLVKTWTVHETKLLERGNPIDFCERVKCAVLLNAGE